jgi:hypothetical protein
MTNRYPSEECAADGNPEIENRPLPLEHSEVLSGFTVDFRALPPFSQVYQQEREVTFSLTNQADYQREKDHRVQRGGTDPNPTAATDVGGEVGQHSPHAK